MNEYVLVAVKLVNVLSLNSVFLGSNNRLCNYLHLNIDLITVLRNLRKLNGNDLLYLVFLVFF